jgi:thiosulfate reductase cytochrome b subunit
MLVKAAVAAALCMKRLLEESIGARQATVTPEPAPRSARPTSYMGAVNPETVQVETRRRILRHGALVRVTHWVNALCLAGLLMSGLQIFNAEPNLYWGRDSDFEQPLLSLDPGESRETAFPGWLTIPGERDLATGRRWHFFFAWLLVLNGAAYLLYGFFSGHFRRDLVPDRRQLRGIGKSIADHARLRFPKGDAARRYNVLQKLSYLAVVFLLLPVMLLAGMTMSPALDAAFPWLLTLFGGRQSARTLHFVFANLIVAFFLVHVTMVILSGLWNNLRSMLTGRYDLERRVDEKKLSP